MDRKKFMKIGAIGTMGLMAYLYWQQESMAAEIQYDDVEIPINEMSVHPIKQMDVNGLEYHYIEKGDGAETIFFIHGFPDLANTWDDTITELSKRYRCVAPFMRGYYPTGMDPNGDYQAKTIAEDIGQLAAQLGIKKYYVVGQDWGASVTYCMASLYPDRIPKIVTIAIPIPRFIKLNFRTAYRARHFFRFRNPKSSLAYTRKNDFAYIDRLFERWSPNWKEYKETSEQLKNTLRKPGRLEAMLGYYWSFNEGRSDEELGRFYNQLPSMPVLALAGKTDGALLMNPFYEMEKLENVKVLFHEEAGHFLHREAPGFFMDSLKAFLES